MLGKCGYSFVEHSSAQLKGVILTGKDMIVISVHIWMAIIDMRGFFMVVSHVPYYQKNEGKLNE